MFKQGGTINWILFVLLSFIWGSSFILMKLSSTHLNGWQIASVRIFSAGLVFLPFAIIHLSKIPRNELGLIILSGLFGNLIPAYLFAIAIEHKLNSSLAGILNSLTPILVIVIGFLFFNLKIGAKKVIGVLIGFAGLLILSLSKGGITGANIWFAFFIILATLSYAINVNLVNYFLKGTDAFKAATISLAFICIPAGIILWQQRVPSLFFNDPAYTIPVFAAIILGVMGSAVATVMFYILIKRAGGVFASLVTYGIPVIAILWGLLYNEEITLIQVGCLAAILGGVFIWRG